MKRTPKKVLVLRSCLPDMKSPSRLANGFVWPVSGPVECADWNATPECGYGLHGLLWGQGDQSLVGDITNDKWLLVEVLAKDIVKIDGGKKVKFPRGEVVYCGDYIGAQVKLMAVATKGKNCASGNYSKAASSGNYSTAASSGNYSTAVSSGYSSKAASSGACSAAASSGNSSTAASSGYYSKAASSGNSNTAASSGYSSTAASSGNSSTAASSGDSSTAASSGYYSKAASSGDCSAAASSGNYSKAASSGNYSKAASSGNYSTAASSGNYSKAAQTDGSAGIAACIGSNGRAKAGANGLIILCYYDKDRYRCVSGCVGENGIKADTWYKLNEKHELEEV